MLLDGLELIEDDGETEEDREEEIELDTLLGLNTGNEAIIPL